MTEEVEQETRFTARLGGYLAEHCVQAFMGAVITALLTATLAYVSVRSLDLFRQPIGRLPEQVELLPVPTESDVIKPEVNEIPVELAETEPADQPTDTLSEHFEVIPEGVGQLLPAVAAITTSPSCAFAHANWEPDFLALLSWDGRWSFVRSNIVPCGLGQRTSHTEFIGLVLGSLQDAPLPEAYTLELYVGAPEFLDHNMDRVDVLVRFDIVGRGEVVHRAIGELRSGALRATLINDRPFLEDFADARNVRFDIRDRHSDTTITSSPRDLTGSSQAIKTGRAACRYALAAVGI